MFFVDSFEAVHRQFVFSCQPYHNIILSIAIGVYVTDRNIKTGWTF